MKREDKVTIEITRGQALGIYALVGKSTGSLVNNLFDKLAVVLGDEDSAKYDAVIRPVRGEYIVKQHEYEDRALAAFFPKSIEALFLEDQIQILEQTILENKAQIEVLKTILKSK